MSDITGPYVEKKHNAFLKLTVIAVLGTVLIAPLSLVQGLVDERLQRSEQVVQEVHSTWGGDQTMKGPVLLIPFREKLPQAGPWLFEERDAQWAYVLPEDLTIEATVAGRELHRGLFHVNAFDGSIDVKGRFPPVSAKDLGLEGKDVSWEHARFVVLTPRGSLAPSTHRVTIGGGTPVPVRPGVPGIDTAGISAELNLSAGRLTQPLSFAATLILKGTGDLTFSPLATTANVSVRSDWDSPNFFGLRSPDERQVGDGGFSARWALADGAAEGPGPHGADSSWMKQIDDRAFGVRLVTPVTDYVLITRAIKHGILFVVLTFAMFLLFEILAGIDLHPLQYLLVGLALAVFYLLLVSLAEHVPFAVSYLVSSLAVVGLIGGYTKAILGGMRRAGLVSGILTATYGILFVTLQAEEFALVTGAASLFVALSAVMYLTRNVDWYALTLRKKAADAAPRTANG